MKIGIMRGPSFGESSSQTKIINLKGHTVQKFEVIEEFNLILAICFSDIDRDD